MKYLVNFFLTQNVKKFVSRLSLLFFCENENEWKFRKFLCEQRRDRNDELILFTRYIDNVPISLISKISEKTVRLILRHLLYPSNFKTLSAKYNHLFSTDTELMQIQLNIVSQDYIRQMKKCRILNELQEINNLESFFKRNIKYKSFFMKIKTPKIGIVSDSRSNIPVKAKIKKLNKESLFENNEVTDVIVHFLEICETMKKNKILIHDIADESLLPLTQNHFEEIYLKYNDKVSDTIHSICKHTLKNAITEKLSNSNIEKEKNQFRFFEEVDYQKSRIRKVLQFFNLILRTKIEELTKSSINHFLIFIRKFSPCNYDKNHFYESHIPLFITDIKVANKEEMKDLKTIFSFTPSIEKYRHSLITAYKHIQKVVNEITDLMSPCIRPLTLKPQLVFELTDDYPLFKEGLDEINEIFDYANERAKEICETYKDYEDIIKYNNKSYIEKNLKFREIQTEEEVHLCGQLLSEMYRLKRNLKLMPLEINQRMFSIRTKNIQDLIIQRIDGIKEELSKNFMIAYSEKCIKSLDLNANSRRENLNKIPKNIQEYDALYKLIQDTPTFVDQKKQELKNIEQIFIILESTFTAFEKNNLKNFIDKWRLPNKVDDAKREGLKNLNDKGVDFKDELDEKKRKLKTKVVTLVEQFEKAKSIDKIDPKTFTNDKREISTFNIYLDECNALKKDIKNDMMILEPDKKGAIENGDEDLPEFETIDNCSKESDDYTKIWNFAEIVLSYNDKIKDEISAINPNSHSKDKSVNETFEFISTLDNCKMNVDAINKRSGGNDITIFKLCSQIKEDIKKFEGYCWIVMNLRSSSLRQEDYEQICKLLEIKDQTELLKSNLKFLKEQKNIDEFRSDIESIKSKASRRAVFMNELKFLQGEFSQLEFLTKITGDKTKIVDIDVLQQKLDEQTNKLQMILGNPVTISDLKLRTDARNYNDKIKIVQNVLEEIIKFQSSYWYLLPIFEGGDVNRELMAEKKKFDQVDFFWKKNIIETIEDPNLSVFIEKDANLLKLLIESNKLIAEIIFELLKYLNTKRKKFPRFYFVSDEDLMKILAQTKDPTLIQGHLSKCFEGINRVQFNESNEIISKMISADGENVNLNENINVMEEECRGKVEVWLTTLEQMMIKTMKMISMNCRNDYINTIKSGKKRIDWLQTNWPGQVIQIIDQEIWTSEVEKSIVASEEDINNYLKQLNEDLRQVVDLIRTNIPKSLSITLSALIIISVHNKDIVESLIEKKITEISDFEWISNMRYEWDLKWNPEKHIKDKCPLQVKMVTSALNYGFEYLGNVSRLVITPLTDRCFRTLFGAFQVKYGGAPEGPAGTGKTESVKDLSKCVGTKCNVFNCTEGINIISMSKFFKGLCSSGCWCCFDEFNRIDTEVLSVIAQQILTIQDALKIGRPNFIFDESEDIEIKDTCAINITMNPSYSGRNDLPDNLKALFRPCAMMVANYYLIAQIKLYSFGFQNAQTIANKVVSSLKLSSEQLSTQTHYDFGMRSLNAILVAAGKLKKIEPDLDEDRIALRALIDVNLPKFTTNDTPLFEGIIGDLFPTTEKIITDYSFLETGLINSCSELNLQPNKNFIKKCIQLYETMGVRHALMLVGLPCLGKSKIIKCLSTAYNKHLDNKLGPVEYHILNPKSILQKQLYGHFNPVSKEWCKGLLQVKMLDLVEKERDINKWLIFDGPVDTLWIENMNSLLDDNKKLCLDDSSSIPLGQNMNILFEVDDLREASPATVSRNGMVLCERDTIKFMDLVLSYASELPSIFEPKFITHFIQILNQLIKPCFAFITKEKQNYGIYLDENHLVKSILELFECYLKDYRLRELQKENITLKESEKITNEKIENMLVFCVRTVVFGIMKKHQSFKDHCSKFFIDVCSGEKDLLNKYELDINKYSYLRNSEDIAPTSSNNPVISPIFSEIMMILNSTWVPKKVGSKISELKEVFEYAYALYENRWKHWYETVEEFTVDSEMNFSELIIPTPETIKMSYLLGMVAPSKMNLLITGNTGTGKTLTIINSLNKNFENESFTYIKLAFTAQTTTELTQTIIENKLSKSYRRFSPSKSRKGILFIDDLNMPEKEKFGAQPPVELLRQWLDYDGWFDLVSDNKDFVKIVDLCLVSCMGSISSGRSVSQRFLRHNIVQFSDSYPHSTIFKIFSNVMNWFFLCNKFDSRVTNLKDQTIESTIRLYQNCSSVFKATPAKTHYLFNLRDVSRVFQGIAKSNVKGIRDEIDFIKLWIHESERVFKDRLVNEEDKNEFMKQIADAMKVSFRRDINNFTKQGTILFANFLPTIHPDDDYTKPPYENVYCEIADLEKMKKKLRDIHDEYNIEIKQKVDSSGSLLNLVFFPYAIEHTCRIARILSTEGGNALLVGLGGSGRKSLSLLTCSIYSYTSFEIENASELKDQDWRDKIKENLLKEKAMQGKETVWIISDTQISSDSAIEDINSFLNNGEIPNLITSEDVNNIKEYIQTQDRLMVKKPVSESDFLNIFIDLCKKNVHIVLCMSPIGEAFRKRVMKFPSLVNCTSIDWFLRWPKEALSSVAEHFLGNLIQNDMLTNISKICVDMQMRVINYADKFKAELKRHYYITPMSFIQLLKLFQNLYVKTDKKIGEEISRYKNGLEILMQAETTSSEMKEKIETTIGPALSKEKQIGEEKVKALEELSIQLKADEEEGEKKEKEAFVSKEQADSKNLEANATLKEIEEMKEEAKKKLGELKQDEVLQLKKSKEDKYITRFCKYLCLLMAEPAHPKAKTSPKGEQLPRDYFAHAVNLLLSKETFMKQLRDFKAQKMSPERAEELQRELEDSSDFDPAKKSKTLENLFEIVKIHSKIYWINQKYIPAKEMAESASKEAKDAQDSLKLIQDNLSELKRIQKEKDQEKRDTDARIKQLEKDLATCKERNKNAEKLVSNLSNEKKNWTASKEQLELNQITLIGDILISSGIVAYLGAFTKAYRTDIIMDWNKLIIQNNIPISKDNPETILQKTLSTSYEIDVWKSKKLPNDSFSVDNAIIMSKSSRFCLLIDPQNQANEWINETYRMNELDTKKKKGQAQEKEVFHVIRPTTDQKQLINKTTECLERGGVLLYENATEQLNSLLMPIFKKEFIEEGTDMYVNFNGNKVYMNGEFKLFITTKIAKPHYLPEICVTFTLVNFTVTEDGLEDQMLNFLVEKDAFEIEMKRRDGNRRMNELNSEKKENELLILNKLNTYADNEDKVAILDDTDLILSLEESKRKADEADLTIARQKEQDIVIEKTRTQYRSVANHVAQLFFTISDLSNMEPVYQYSLNWFRNIFDIVIKEVQLMNIQDKNKKNTSLKDEFTGLLYDKVCLSLFEKDKLVFSFMLFMKIHMIPMKDEEKLTYNKEIRYLVTGGSGKEFDIPNPTEHDGHWISKVAWFSICELCTISSTFKGLKENFTKNIHQWKEIFEDQDPFKLTFPDDLENLSIFHKLCVGRSICPDKVVPIIKDIISNSLGEKYTKAPEFDMDKAYKESKNTTPIFFILSPGADPIVIIEKLAKSIGKNWQDDCKKLSLGQGQRDIAIEKIRNGIQTHKWIILQNCHLAKSFMDDLEKEIESFIEDESSNFRLFLTASPSDVIPISIVQNSIKLTNEPPRGIRQSLYRSFCTFDEKFYETSKKPSLCKKFIYTYCFFHALILERRKYGPLGWNIPYEFSFGDLGISLNQMKLFLNDYSEIQWEAMWYMVAEANYGGRVTDPADRVLINTCFTNLCNSNLLESEYYFNDMKDYPLPIDMKYNDILKYINSNVPFEDKPEVFGLHSNADITYAINETNQLLGTVLLTLPRLVAASKDGGGSIEDIVQEKALQVKQKLPKPFNLEAVREKHEVKHNESLNSVLHQEIMRYNNLIIKVNYYMTNVIDAIKGDAVMTAELEGIVSRLYDNKTPLQIEKIAYPSLMPFSSWVNDLVDKLNFIQNWIDEGIPKSFWISGFFFTQSFLTGVLQNYARKVS